MKKKMSKNLLLVLVVTIVLTPFSAVLARNPFAPNPDNKYDRYLIERIKSVCEYFKGKPAENKKKEIQSELTASERAEILKEVREDPKNIQEKARAATKASENLKDKAKEVYAVIKDFAGSSFDDQCKAALDDLKKNPNSLKLQSDMCNILMAYTDKLYNSFKKAEQADLDILRDRIVQGFKTVSELKTAEAQKYQNRANSAQGKWKIRYE